MVESAVGGSRSVFVLVADRAILVFTHPAAALPAGTLMIRYISGTRPVGAPVVHL